MIRKSFRYKILFIFLLPSFVTAYFAYYFFNLKYQSLQQSEIYLYASKNIQYTSKLIHSLQLERGLSSGYIVSNDKQNLQSVLIKRQNLTQEAFEAFIQQVTKKDPIAVALDRSILHKNETILKEIIEQYYYIKDIRKEVLDSGIDFSSEIAYYTTLNKKLLDLIQVYLLNLNGNFEKSILMLEYLKENAGLERAYLYNYIISQDFTKKYVIQDLIKNQKKYKKEFLLYSPIENILLFNKTVSPLAQKKVEEFRKLYFAEKISSSKAQEWFTVATFRINQFETFSLKLLEIFADKFEKKYNKDYTIVLFTSILIVLAIISIIMLLWYLIKLIDKEEKLLEDLRISSYTFDSQEAVTITDANGKILKVNKAFTEITGYTPQEVIGKDPSILKSGKHTNKFYQDMWMQLHKYGKWSGEVYNKRKNGEIYPEKLSITAIKNEEGITTHYIAQFVDISDLKKAQEKAIYQATHDFLTKLPNRKSMLERLQEEMIRAKRHNYLDAFLFLDLDRFKKINDAYGHKTGDKVLIEVSKRLKESVHKDDFIARISGDEFCIILINLENDQEKMSHYVKEICEKIIQSIAKPIIIDGIQLNIGVSIGIKFFPDGDKNADEIINIADAAMYKAKENGKNQFVFFNEEIERKMKELAALENEIKIGFQKDEFDFYMQPKVYIGSNEVVGAEMLVRWIHPTKGILLPGYFIDTLKELGFGSKITYKALKNACDFIKENPNVIKATLSINVSVTDLLSKKFIHEVIDIIKESQIDPKFIEFEILENDLIENFDVIIENINQLKQFGIKISIDDFGTGYSSISYLRKLPVDTLKVDRYFIKNIDDIANRKLVEMVLDVAKSFGFEVVVEGVETQEQLSVLEQNGAKCYQGYFFSKPVPKEEFLQLLS